jgi:hypothetical protein
VTWVTSDRRVRGKELEENGFGVIVEREGEALSAHYVGLRQEVAWLAPGIQISTLNYSLIVNVGGRGRV